MSEQNSKPIAGNEASPRPEVRVAVSSTGPGRWAWGLTLAVILAGGLALYATRSAVSPALDRWLPLPARSEPPAAPEALESPPEPASLVEEPAAEWSFVDIEAVLVPLPKETETLIAEGREELSQFAGLDAADETRALLARNRWRLWGRIWRNRVDQIRRRLPPIEECEVHAALEPTCRALFESLAALRGVPEATRLDEARTLFDQAGQIWTEFHAAREKETETLDAAP